MSRDTTDKTYIAEECLWILRYDKRGGMKYPPLYLYVVNSICGRIDHLPVQDQGRTDGFRYEN